jgi:Flp pilus assembly protein TadD
MKNFAMKNNEMNLTGQTVSLLAMIAASILCLTPVSGAQAQDGMVSAVGDDSLGNNVGTDLMPVGEPQVIDGASAASAASQAPSIDDEDLLLMQSRQGQVTSPASETSATQTAPLPTAPLSAADEPAPITQVTPLPTETEQGVAEGGTALDPSGQMQKHSGQYFDGTRVVPDPKMSNLPGAAPRMVDPKYQPASRYAIAHGTASAKSFEAQYVAATRAIKLQRYAAAMEMFEKLYRQNSKDPRVLMGLAVSQQGAGFTESAAQTYEELLSVQPNNANAIVNLMGIMKNQYPSVTLNRLMELRQKYPNNAGIPAQIGLVNADLSNFDDSIRYFEIAASMEPSNPSHIYNMAIVADKQGQIRKAIQNYERALQMEAAAIGSSTETLPREQIYDRLVVLRRKI